MDGPLGADVTDLDVRRMDTTQLAGIRAALLEYHVLALRNQQLDPAALSAFAARLGEREVYPFAQSLPDDPYVVPIIKEPEDESNFGGIWHTDSSYLPEPPSLTMLYAALPLRRRRHAVRRHARRVRRATAADSQGNRRTDGAIHHSLGYTAPMHRLPAPTGTGARPARPSPMRFIRWSGRILTAEPRRCTSASRTRAVSSGAHARTACRC